MVVHDREGASEAEASETSGEEEAELAVERRVKESSFKQTTAELSMESARRRPRASMEDECQRP